jgi:LPPG:FO 2-phospho-L-lactate transferase
VGAARLLRGFARVVDPKRLTVVVNTGDDETFYGLHVSPDLDTIVYTLAGLASVSPGWGIAGDSFRAKAALDRLYGGGWFNLGDADLATHVFRTERLRAGWTVSRVTAELCRRHGIDVRVLPVTDDSLRTIIHTRSGPLPFQEYLVKRRARPRVERVSFRGASQARPAPGVLAAISGADVVVIAPSNPFVSVRPMLAVPGVRATLRAARGKAVAVSPLVAGRAVKGPLASMLRSQGYAADSASIAKLYRGLVATLIVAPGDGPRRPPAGGPAVVEHEILIHRRAMAERLVRFALEHVVGVASEG